MIGKISGKLLIINPPQVLVETNSGISYEIDLSMADFTSLPKINEEVNLYTHLVVKEDAHLLYGFLNLPSRDCFRTLIKVSGIGPRIALALLATLSLDNLMQALDTSDTTTLCLTPGVGKKMAERMILELKGKLVSAESVDTQHVNNKDIANALASLGYNDKEISLVIKQLPKDIPNINVGIKEALKLISKK